MLFTGTSHYTCLYSGEKMTNVSLTDLCLKIFPWTKTCTQFVPQRNFLWKFHMIIFTHQYKMHYQIKYASSCGLYFGRIKQKMSHVNHCCVRQANYQTSSSKWESFKEQPPVGKQRKVTKWQKELTNISFLRK